MDNINNNTPSKLERVMLYQSLTQLKEFKRRISQLFTDTVQDGNKFPPIFDAFYTDVEGFIWSQSEVELGNIDFAWVLQLYTVVLRQFLTRQLVHGNAYSIMIDDVATEFLASVT